MFEFGEIRIHPTGSGIAGSAPNRRARVTRRPTRRSSPPSSGSRPTTSWSRRATPTRRPTASAPTARARRRCRAPRPRWPARKINAKAQMIAAYLLEVHDDDLEWDVDRFRVQGQSGALQDHDRARLGGLQRSAAGHGAGPRGDQLLRSAELHLSVRRLYLRRRCRRRYRVRPRCVASTRSTIAARASIR